MGNRHFCGRPFHHLVCGTGALLCALAGCATVEPHLMPTPAEFKNERLERMPWLPPEMKLPRPDPVPA